MQLCNAGRQVADSIFRVVIPARFASTRFPGKALASLAGKPMIQHVYERARGSRADEVIIATDDERIAATSRNFGATVVMTRASHQSGTDRVAEVAEQMGWSADTVVVNVQGDVPLIPCASIDQVAKLLVDNVTVGIATLCAPITTSSEYHDRNVVKVVFDASGRAMYFSRAAIPSYADDLVQPEPDFTLKAWRHIGIYAYRVQTLKHLTAAQPCALENYEKLEQLRALWHGIEIRVGAAVEAHGPDVDTPGDLRAAEKYLSVAN
jgi:3-deoxy-manno-octulosonate cytidylyltransferase (CMP-KDO synthetase)